MVVNEIATNYQLPTSNYLQTKFSATSMLPLPLYCAICGYGQSGRVRSIFPSVACDAMTSTGGLPCSRHCSSAAVMVGGKLVLQGTAADLADRKALVASYLGEEPALAGEEVALHREAQA